MKKSVGDNTYMFPLPSVVVGTYDSKDKPNIMTASWTGIVNSKPTMISVSLRKATYSYNNIIDKGAFTVSIPSKKHIVEMDYVGTKSGRNEDKFLKTGLTPIKSEIVEAPYVSEFPVVLECRLVKYEDLGLHTMFIGEVKDVKIDEEYLKENGMPDMMKIDPVAYAHGDREYYEIGEYLGKANRLWQNTTRFNNLKEDYERDILGFILEYYEKLDGSVPMEEFKRFFNWEDFQIHNAGTVIDSLEAYEKWYEEVLNTMFNKKHIIEKIGIKREGDEYEVDIDVHFTCNTWKKKDARSNRVEVKGKIIMGIMKDTDSNQYRIKRYIVWV